MGFEKANFVGSQWVDVNGTKVLHVEESHALIMAAGYLKHNSLEGVYFRGQSNIYPELRPALYRGIDSDAAKYRRESKLLAKIDDYKSKCNCLVKMNDYVPEPLLQHYGLQTTWLDLVDNIWVALWFACHEAKVTRDGHFLHFQKRIVNSDNQYAYIYLVGADLDKRNKGKPGYWNGENTELIDLRIAAPSYFLRPHAQHGLLFRCKGKENGRPLDYSKQVRGLVRIPLEKAMDWLGEGHVVGIHSLFPPAYYDNGYKILLQSGVTFDNKEKYIGVVHSVGA
ncbi:FRG domain-containing protein [Vibrio diabolicus]|uniref:FRG domain-containing protein n=1 Tax=Vibrio harveyi group TaxID=717610 RepID=UPI00111CD01D|nr:MULTISPECIES: FRG domain-containing protein [Vibrio harveyi group]EIA0834497.1 FRG domain-containing protein [Vibrio parahaemolyticus]MCR9303920.1 FRG domain-containing protein [Vibrio diabolicus]MCR9426782.1 FRG domain-containing protein [Vibrio diabolicus]MCS0365721.1 FRG domain-containing protein [Vibrio diabolicus]MCS0383832.1 FRG domain-containing protein [Vibrio diabolicus]